MDADQFYTTGHIAAVLGQPVWRIRRIVDDLGLAATRQRNYRLVSGEQFPAIGNELVKRGWATAEAAPCL